MMQALESEEMPPPRPSSWRPYGSGLPSARRRISSRDSPAGGRSSAWKTRHRLVPPRMYTARMRRWLMASRSCSGRSSSPLAPGQADPHGMDSGSGRRGAGVRQDAPGQQDVALAWREDARRGEAGSGPRVGDGDPRSRRQRRAQSVQAQPIAALDSFPVARVIEDEGHETPVDEIGAVDARERLGDDRADPEMHRAHDRGLAR